MPVSLLFRALLALFIASAAALPTMAAEGPVSRTENVAARLVADHNVVVPGQTLNLALHKQIRDNWHTYWINPGSAGQATEMEFAPGTVAVDNPFVWPLPKAIPIGQFVTSYGYEGEILLVRPVTLPDDLVPGTQHTIRADAFWLVCEDICIPEDTSVELTLPVGDVAQFDTDWGGRIDRAIDIAPKTVDWPARLTRAGDAVALSVLPQAIAAGDIRNPDFFPTDPAARKAADAAQVALGSEGLRVMFTPGPALRQSLSRADGMLRFEQRTARGWQPTGVLISAAPGDPLDIGALQAQADAGQGGEASSMGLLTALVFAFIGGLILNLMPCVFPILFVKALSFTRVAHEDVGRIRSHGLLFLAGVLVSFAAFAAIIIAVQASGALVGWGFQLQSPTFVFALALLFVLIGLNLLGVFEIGGSLQNVGAGLAAKDNGLGAFFTGVVAVVVATPCTAPFMAGALGYTLGQPAPVVLAVFLALGLGLAAPFVLVSFVPAIFRALPRPGAWMDKFRQILAFPMFLTAIWLLWVFGRQLGVDAAMLALSALVLVALAVVLWNMVSGRGAGALLARALAIVLFAGSLVAVFGTSRVVMPSGQEQAVDISDYAVAWTPDRVGALQAEGKAVFVDFTAAWCITCKFNERAVLATKAMQDAFAQNNVAFVVADWTARDDDIAEELRRHGRTGVPLYLLYSPDSAEPKVLPQLLTHDIVISAINEL